MVKTFALLAATPAVAEQINNNDAGMPAPRQWQPPTERDDVPWDYQRDSHSDNSNKKQGYPAPHALQDADAEPFWCVDQARTGCP